MDAPTEFVPRQPGTAAHGVPDQRSPDTPAPAGRTGGAVRAYTPGPASERPGPTTAPGGRRHHRAGSRPAAEFTAGTGVSTGKRGRRRRGTFWRELPMLVVVALVLTFLIQTFLARVYEIPSGSMEQTLLGGRGVNDRVLVDKLSYNFGEPAPGDVVVFAGPENWQDDGYRSRRSENALVRGLQSLGSLVGLAPPDEKDLIKRVIAVGGQTVACCDSRNRVTVNGKPLEEPYVYYLPEAGPATQAEFGPVRVPDGELWVMGDSRNNSADSRVPGHGPIPVGNVIGKARFIVLPFSRVSGIPDTNPQRRALVGPAR
ncbi:MAG: signal peptidase I [Pseudonocardia sp.]